MNLHKDESLRTSWQGVSKSRCGIGGDARYSRQPEDSLIWPTETAVEATSDSRGYTADMSSKIQSSLGAMRSSVNLVRSSHSWTEAESAAGFVLRYLTPMRKQLIATLGTARDADQALKMLLTHLVSAGFGDHKKGLLRDFLVKAVRSCARARLTDKGRVEAEEEKLSALVSDSKSWLVLWRDCLLERAWRALERQEHAAPTQPFYSVLWHSTVRSKATDAELAKIVKEQTGQELNVGEIPQMKVDAKAAFAQLLADEIVETLEVPNGETVKREIQVLGIGSAFAGLSFESTADPQ
ncbi:MAG: hypothetical protein AAF802_25400 [Planctomycetota bacterium]